MILNGDGMPPNLSILDGFDAYAREIFANDMEWFSLPGGAVLFEEGAAADGLYIVLSGTLGVFVREPREPRRLVDQVQAGQTVGEMALLSDRPRSATVIALRDSSLLRLPKATFAQMIQIHPAAVLQLSSLLVDRLARTTHRSRPIFATKVLALVPADPAVSLGPLTQALAGALAATGMKVKILDDQASHETTEFFHSVETAHDLTLYRGDSPIAPWAPLCMRRADRILLVASAASSPRDPVPPVRDANDFPWRVTELVILHDGGHAAPAAPWLSHRNIRRHFHVRAGRAADIERLARYVTGRAVGLVLSGGGARGYAHVGVIKALREAGIPLDLVGGTSFGALIAAGVACEWDDAEFHERLHAAFVQSDPLNDYAIPMVALTKGHKVTRRLREHFGERRMEDLWRPCFALAANLTTGHPVVQKDGLVWKALRASIAIPGLLPPWIVGGEVLVDGAVMNNLPTDVMSDMGLGPVVAVDVARYEALRPATPTKRRRFWPPWRSNRYGGVGIVNTLIRSATVSSDAQATLCRGLADLLFEPPLRDIDLRDWKALARAAEAGYRYAMGRIDEIDRLRSRVSQPPGSDH